MFMNKRVNPANLERDILAHAVSFKLSHVNPRFKAVSNLAIVGPSGCGKSTGVRDICAKLEIALVEVQASDLVSHLEGQGTAALEDAILEASEIDDVWLSAVLIDDAGMGGDSRLGSVTNRATQGFQMSWYDRPDHIKIERPNQRAKVIKLRNPVASFMTANSLDALHPPIVAPHRSSICIIDPQGEEKERIVGSMFAALGEADALKLAQHFADQSLAFFASLRTEVAKDVIMSGAEHLNFKFGNVDWDGFDSFVSARAENAKLDDLISAGEKIASQDRTADFIAPPKPMQKPEVFRRSTRKPKAKLNGTSGRKNGQCSNDQLTT